MTPEEYRLKLQQEHAETAGRMGGANFGQYPPLFKGTSSPESAEPAPEEDTSYVEGLDQLAMDMASSQFHVTPLGIQDLSPSSPVAQELATMHPTSVQPAETAAMEQEAQVGVDVEDMQPTPTLSTDTASLSPSQPSSFDPLQASLSQVSTNLPEPIKAAGPSPVERITGQPIKPKAAPKERPKPRQLNTRKLTPKLARQVVAGHKTLDQAKAEMSPAKQEEETESEFEPPMTIADAEKAHDEASSKPAQTRPPAPAGYTPKFSSAMPWAGDMKWSGPPLQLPSNSPSQDQEGNELAGAIEGSASSITSAFRSVANALRTLQLEVNTIKGIIDRSMGT
jgi:hypothetical protein